MRNKEIYQQEKKKRKEEMRRKRLIRALIRKEYPGGDEFLRRPSLPIAPYCPDCGFQVWCEHNAKLYIKGGKK